MSISFSSLRAQHGNPARRRGLLDCFALLAMTMGILLALPAMAAPLKIVASFSILGDLASQIAGDRAQVETLVGPDSDSHVYQPTPNDAKKLAHADLVIVNGLGFEGWIKRLVETANYKGTVLTVTEGLPKTLTMPEDEGHGHHHGHHDDKQAEIDPHAWQNLANGRFYVANIAKALSAADPDGAAIYQANAAKLDQELAALDGWVRAQIAMVPVEKRRVITAHDAFGYFADAYGVEFIAPVGINTEDEPSAKELKALIKQIKTGKTRALFIENMSNPAIIKQLAEETGAIVGPRLYADALSEKTGPANNYQAMFRHNVGALVAGMGQ